MFGPTIDQGSGSASRPIPPIEIGSFVALSPDDSEFIGSASGAFFANTVFRAFARAASATDADLGRPEEGRDAGHGVPDPGSAHTYLVAPEHGGEQTTDNEPRQQDSPTTLAPGTRSYGVTATGLGIAPPPAVAQKLLMLYFRNWHPFLPFLHGPTFIESVNRFYDEDILSEDAPTAHPSRLTRAVTFQCIFNITALASGETLDPACRIQSSFALTSLIGVIFSSHDIASLQALLAAELYLTTTMSLRAASAIHGALVRTMYNSGFHRCPCRYIQLQSTVSMIRKRIFWCAYVLDRYLSQVLGHPSSIEDGEVDVCIPGMVELHRAVTKPSEPVVTSQSTLNEEVLDHLPSDRAATDGNDGEVSPQRHPSSRPRDAAGGSDSLTVYSPAQHHTAAGKEAGQFVLSYMATYSRLMGEIVSEFHRSIHSRAISPEKIEELTYRIHCWWNSLPPTFQDETHDVPASTPSSYTKSPWVALFTMLYNYLILLVNRPFLSLPTDRKMFRSSLQTALSASHNTVMKLRWYTDDPFVMAWPGTLSATWMAGLAIAFATQLELYPFAKGSS